MKYILFILFSIYILIVPFILGIPFRATYKEKKIYLKAIYTYIVGFFVMYALYELVEMPLILFRAPFDMSCNIFSVVTLIVCVLILFLNRKSVVGVVTNLRKGKNWNVKDIKFSIYEIIYAVAAFALLAYQLYHTYFYQINEWSYDDEPYISWANDALYYNEVFAGIAIPAKRLFQTSLFLPAYFSNISGVQVAAMEHTVLSVIILLLSYGVFWLIANKLIKSREDRFIFMILLELASIYGFYSMYSTTCRLLGPIWPGKAILATVLNPLFIFIMLCATESGYDRKYGYLLAVMSMGAVALTLGGIISILAFICIITFVYIIKYHDREHLKYILYIIWSCVIPGICGVIYMLRK